MKQTLFRRTVAIVAVAAHLGLGLPAAAQDTGDTAPTMIGEVQLFGEEDVQIEAATKTAIPLSKAPGAVTVITARQIRESGARTIPELLRLVAGVNVRWNPMVQTIDMRGFGQNPFTSRVLLLIDGVPYNDWNQGGFSQHPGLDFFVVQNVKRIEVLKGPGSSLYGENAFWGVINIVTLSGEDLQGGRVEAFGGGERDTASGGFLYGKKIGEGSVFASAKYLKSRLPMNFWKTSDSKGTDIFLKGTYKRLQASYYRHQDSMDGFEFVIPATPPLVWASADKVGSTVQIAALKWDQDPKDRKLTIGVNASFAHRYGTHCAACHAAKQAPGFDEKQGHGFQLLGDFRLNYTGIENNDLLIGVEGRKVDAGDTRELAPPGLKLDEYTYAKVAAYLQDQISLANDKVRIVAGVRYDGKTDLFDDKLSPRVAVVVNPNDALALRAGYGTAFRFPNFTELAQNSWFLNFDRGAGPLPVQVFKPNQDLQPEESRTFDAGVEYRFSPQLSAKVDAFTSEVRNFLVLAANFTPGVTPTFGYENHGADARVTGIEAELRWNVSNKTTGFVNYTRQKNTQKGQAKDSSGKALEFVYSPESKLNLGAYAGPFAGVRGAVELSWRDEVITPTFWGTGTSTPLQPGQVPTLDAFSRLNARVSYDLPFDVGKQKTPVRLAFYGHNLLDKTLRETQIGVDTHLVGRELFAEISFDFK
jgi:iron complex outermembrane receptor protein